MDGSETFLLFVLVGFLAQLVDGALGMAYGLVSSTVLLSLGVPPATASAAVHAAEVVTTGIMAFSLMSLAWLVIAVGTRRLQDRDL